jgi:hypothetical protein
MKTLLANALAVVSPWRRVILACSHANSNMSSQQNFRNPTHGSEVVNVTRCAPWPTWPGQAGPSVPKIPQKFHQIAQNKREKFVKKNIFGKIWSNMSIGFMKTTMSIDF